jgi:hypothetical protein
MSCPRCGTNAAVPRGHSGRARGSGQGRWQTCAHASFLTHLTANAEFVAACSVLRQVIALADDAPTLTDEQLRARLLALAGRG